MEGLLPALRPADWPERARCWHRPLLPIRAEGVPIVTLCRPLGPLQAWLGADGLAAWGGAEEAERRAIAQLAAEPAPWRTVQRPTPGGGWLELQVLEGPRAAERILDRDALRALGERSIGSRTLAVGIPRGDLLLAVHPASALEDAFPRVLRALYGEAAQPLSPRAFLVDDGALVGLVGGSTR